MACDRLAWAIIIARTPNNLIMVVSNRSKRPSRIARPGRAERERMSATQQVLAAGRPVLGNGRWRPAWRGHLHGSEFAWAIAFVVPYAAVFLVFAVYPIVYGFWMASEPSLYADLISDPIYTRTVVNTLLFVGIGVNLKMFLALLLSGFFMRRRWWIKALLVIYILPWALSGHSGLYLVSLDADWSGGSSRQRCCGACSASKARSGSMTAGSRSDATSSPTSGNGCRSGPLIFLAGRMAIPREIHEAADMDGATGLRRFVHVTFPLLANIYLICTLLSTIWALGDFNTVSLVSGGAPKMSTDVLATLGIRYAFDMARPELAVAAAMSALPLLIPIVIVLMRRAADKGGAVVSVAPSSAAGAPTALPHAARSHRSGLGGARRRAR